MGLRALMGLRPLYEGSPFYSARWPPVWLPRLLSHWSGSRVVPLTLVLRFLASTELLYSSTIPASPTWSSWEPSDLSGIDQDDPPLAWCRIPLSVQYSRNQLWHYHCNYGTWLVLHWSVSYEATNLLGVSIVFQKATSEPAGKVKKLTAWHLMPPN
jgi:hypothetical protein